MNITSAAGVVALLDEPVPELVIFALRKLNTIVDEFWPEVSEVIEKLEILTEDKKFTHRELASLLASKVHYHLCSYEDSLMYALGAGDLFQVNSNSEYVQTMISKAIDVYTAKRIKVSEGKEGEEVDPRLEAIVNRMFERCFQHRQFKQALGVALETRRMDIFEQAILKSDDIGSMLAYAFKVTMTFIQNRQFRNEILRYLVNLYKNLRTPDYLNMCQCLIFLDDPMAVSEMLVKLSGGDEDSRCLSYQIAFDLYESATQQFLSRVLEGISSSAPMPLGADAQASKTEEDTSEAMQVDTEGGEEKKEKDEPSPKAELSETDKACQERLEKLSLILRGSVSIDSHLQFQIRSNHTDMLILKHTKEAVRVSACHNATVIANGFMHCGTTSDQFLRDNLDWLSRATNWAKFTATASLGVIHRGHEKEALSLMQAYLPRDSSGSGSGYAEGGSLYALGLIHANHGEAILKYLLQQLNDAQNEMVRHGGCLGLGLAAMSTHREDLYEQLRFNLYQDDAVTGEAAGIAMGLVMLGSKCPKAIEDMVAYAQETQHEKILRGLAVGISLIMYGRLEEADALITSLCQDKDPVLRRSGMYTVAMAYAGTGNNEAIRKLLHVAVSDVNDDVRRAAVEAIGFLLFRTPEQCPSLVSLLSESYNPHVRYGAAMALGIACAGTGLKEAIGLLEPMTNDPVNYVRQGALISSALVMIQQTETTCPKVKDFRTLYSKVISDKHEDVMAKFGAILAQGILDAGGRNVTISLQSRTGHTNMTSVVGLLVFSQFWYWYPLSHFLSLAFTPTTIIGLNSDLKMPKVQFKSNAKPSMFAYPAPLEEKKKEEREKVTTAVLSITAKAKKKEDAKKKEEKMDVDEEEKTEKEKGEKEKEKHEKEKTEKEKPEKEKTEKDKAEKEKTEKEKPEKEKAEKEKGDKDKEKDKKDKKEEKKDEPSFELMDNPARVVRPQLRLMSMEGNSWVPLRPLNGGGIIVLKPTDPSKPVQLVEPVLPVGSQQGKQEDEQEPEPPQPFLYVED